MSVVLINAINNMKNITFASFLRSRKFPSVEDSRSQSKLCSSHHYNKLATDFDDFNVDIFDSSQQKEKNIAIDAAKVLWVKVLHRFGNMSSWDSSHVLDPLKSNCVWLTVDKLSRGGIGHSFRAWDLFLQLSELEKYTYYAPFFTPFHGLCNLKETVDFFGFHNIFYWARAPPPSAIVIPVGDPVNGGCDQEQVKMAAYYYQERYGKFNCSNNHIVFYCYNFGKGSTTFSTSFKDSLHISRIVFDETRKTQRSKKYSLAAVEEARKCNSVIIAVHIRRGDILSSKYVEKKRLISFGFYKSVLKKLVALRGIPDKSNESVLIIPISIFILTEGKKPYLYDNDTLVEYKIDPINPSRVISGRSVSLYSINVADAIRSFCSPETHCDIEVFSNISVYSSFLTLCESDIMVTGASQFSVMAMALCQPRLTLAVQFGDDFRGQNNVLIMRGNDETYGMWHNNASILWTRDNHERIAVKAWQNIEKQKRYLNTKYVLTK